MKRILTALALAFFAQAAFSQQPELQFSPDLLGEKPASFGVFLSNKTQRKAPLASFDLRLPKFHSAAQSEGFLQISHIPYPIGKLPPAWTFDNLPFFCKLEVNLQRSAELPVRFRLGDVDYVDRLEGKNNSYDAWMRAIGGTLNFIVNPEGLKRPQYGGQ